MSDSPLAFFHWIYHEKILLLKNITCKAKEGQWVNVQRLIKISISQFTGIMCTDTYIYNTITLFFYMMITVYKQRDIAKGARIQQEQKAKRKRIDFEKIFSFREMKKENHWLPLVYVCVQRLKLV